MSDNMKVLIFGKSGWIGGLLGEELTRMGIDYEYAGCRLEDRSAIQAEIDRVKPTHVMNCAGVTGRPNVDWCESNRQTVVRANVVGCLTLADVCCEKKLHMTNFATGCIFQYDEEHTIENGKGFLESDTPNFTGSYYSHTKAIVENLLEPFSEHVLTLRVRMPIVGDLTYPRNFIAKILRYEKIVDIPNSMTVIPEMLPLAVEMAKRKLTGVMNYTNPGAVSHNEIMEMYKQYVDPELTWSNFTLEEQAKVIVAPRSNNTMDTTRLRSEFPEVLGIKESLVKYVFEPAAAHKEEVAASVREMRGR